MHVNFNITYHTQWGQRLKVVGSHPALGNWQVDQAPFMEYDAEGSWNLSIDIPAEELISFTYKYCIDEGNGASTWEWGKDRVFELKGDKGKDIAIQDFWRPHALTQNALHSSTFTQVLMKRNPKKRRKARPKTATHRFQLLVPRIAKQYDLCIIGSDPALGAWDEQKALILDDKDYPLFRVDVKLKKPAEKLSYKYAIYDKAQKQVVTWENRDNRELIPSEDVFTVRTDEQFEYPVGNWKGTGVAIPVFSLRSEQGLGVGEFTDLIPLVDWAKSVGMELVQILPINDTTAKHTWEDSYPYAAISVFALHPQFVNIEKIGDFEDKSLQAEYEALRTELNALSQVDYDVMMAAKWKFLHALYDQQKPQLRKDKAFQRFIAEEATWLKPYAAFCALRDRYHTVDYTQWQDFAGYDEEALTAHFDPETARYEEIEIHYFVQYHLFMQMQEVADYARAQGVVLKGDIPIGIFRNSVDSWVAPHLYYMGSQAGAPPDAFAEAGQNWGFPTYNWQAMAEDDYAWWRLRLSAMARFFDAYRIDHILGFFRIWEIPIAHTEGLMGHFNPDLPLAVHEIHDRLGWFDYDRFCRPYVREHLLQSYFGPYVNEVKWNCLSEVRPGQYFIKEEFNTQQKVEAYFTLSEDSSPADKSKAERIKRGLNAFIGEVLFFEIPFSEGKAFQPRISMHHTRSYQELDPGTQNRLDQLYTHYFYKRHDSFWREQAMVKLPAITSATDMLVCGEDLGMVPDCVPGVMDELGILSLEIQRMPKEPGRSFGHPADAPYLSVVSPGSHDMATLRGWWEEDHELSQQFFGEMLGHHGEAPFFAEPWLCREIINQHLYSPAMWAIFPIQDLIAMDGELRHGDTHAERINVPANPKHYWRYRFHLSVEELQQKEAFNTSLKTMIEQSGRTASY